MSSSAQPSVPAPRPSSFDASSFHEITEDEASAPPLTDKDLRALPSEYREAVAQLQDTIEQAVETIAVLRAENERLSERVDVLEKRPDVPDDATVVTLDDSPDALREQIRRFIAIIDDYLNTGDGAAAPASLSSLPADWPDLSDDVPSDAPA